MSLRGYWRTLSERIDHSPRDQDHQVDDDREDRAPDEDVGELHQLSSGFGAGSFDGLTSRCRPGPATPLRSLKTPEVTTSWPGLRPSSTATWSPRAAPSFTNCWRAPRYFWPFATVQLPDHEDGVAVGRVADRRRRQRHEPTGSRRPAAAPARTCRGAGGPPGLSSVARTRTLRVASSTTASMALKSAQERLARRPRASRAPRRRGAGSGDLLLRQREVDEDRLERLQRARSGRRRSGTGRG